MKTPVYGFCLVLIALLFASCSITSRKYMPGYNVEWKAKSPATHQNAVIAKSVEQVHPKSFPLVNQVNAVEPPKSHVNNSNALVNNKVVAHEPMSMHTRLKTITLPHIENSKLAGTQPDDAGKNDFGIKLAKQSLLFGIIACGVTLGFGIVILYSVIAVTQKLIVEIVIIGLVALGIALIAFFKGRRSMPILFGDDTVDNYYKLASIGKAMGYTIIICLLLSLVIALAFFN